MAGVPVRGGTPYSLVISLFKWAHNDWVLLEGEALYQGIDLRALAPAKLYSWLVAKLIRTLYLPEGSAKAEKQLIAKLLEIAKEDEKRSDSTEETIVDMMAPPIPGLREAPAGVIMQ